MQLVKRPVTGVATLLINDGKLLLGFRTKSPGKDSWQCPGGLLDAGESVFDCAIREVKEETGLDIDGLEFGPYTNNYFEEENFHSVTLYVTAKLVSGKLQNNEPGLAKNWAWYAKDKIPGSLFLPLQILMREQPAFWDQLF